MASQMTAEEIFQIIARVLQEYGKKLADPDDQSSIKEIESFMKGRISHVSFHTSDSEWRISLSPEEKDTFTGEIRKKSLMYNNSYILEEKIPSDTLKEALSFIVRPQAPRELIDDLVIQLRKIEKNTRGKSIEEQKALLLEAIESFREQL